MLDIGKMITFEEGIKKVLNKAVKKKKNYTCWEPTFK